MNPIVDLYRSGRSVKPLFFLRSEFDLAVPAALRRRRCEKLIRSWQDRPDADYLADRLDFYCPRKAFSRPDPLDPKALPATEIPRHAFPSTYYFEIRRLMRYFPPEARIAFFGGDVWQNPEYPTLMKARRLDANAGNAILLKLNAVRHYHHPRDPIPFVRKKPVLIFRGVCDRKPARLAMLRQWAGNPLCDLGDTSPVRSQWSRPPISIAAHFPYQFILAPEGNDVASALQWIMASGSVPVMPHPTVESWLMHSRLVPGRHYIETAPDYSDLGDRVEYYVSRPREAQLIAEESQRWAAQFADPRRELLIQLLVISRYLRLTGQA